MRDRQVLITTAIVFFVTLVLLSFFRTTVASIFVEPLLYLFWLGDLILKSIDQRYLWWFLMGVMVIILLRGLLQQQRQDRTYSKPVIQIRRTQRVRFWNARIRRMLSGTYPEDYSKHELRKLVLDVLGYRLNLSAGDVEQGLKNGELELPEEIQPLFSQNLEDPKTRSKSLFSGLLQRFQQIFAREPSSSSNQFNLEIEALIEYLEKQLEIHREH